MEFRYNCDLREGSNFVILRMILRRKN